MKMYVHKFTCQLSSLEGSPIQILIIRSNCLISYLCKQTNQIHERVKNKVVEVIENKTCINIINYSYTIPHRVSKKS